MKKIIYFFSLWSMLNVNSQTLSWSTKSSLPSNGRSASSMFAIGAKVYLALGRGTATNTQEVWEYDTLTNNWLQKSNFPGVARSGAFAFVYNGKAYLGNGFDGTNYLSDVWEYNPVTDIWTQKNNFPGIGRADAIAFVIGNKGYIATGHTAGNTTYNDLWEYNVSTDTWTQKANLTAVGRSLAVGFSITGTGKGYVGTGTTTSNIMLNDFWEYDPTGNIWTQKANFSGGPRMWASGFSLTGKGYIGTGLNPSFAAQNDMREFDPTSNTWATVSPLPGPARIISGATTCGAKGYLGFGQSVSGSYYNDVFALGYGPTGLNETENLTELKIYPTLTENFLFIESKKEIKVISINDMNGKSVPFNFNRQESKSKIEFDLPSGIYFIKIQVDEGVINKKIVIN